jgi:monothiol glutaredoxin
MNPETKNKIEQLTQSSKFFLFMKGTPQEPACGFSHQVVQILNEKSIEFSSFDILSDEDIRQGVKDYANWPTIPQLYVEGKFVGGCDIITQMAQNGELEKLK